MPNLRTLLTISLLTLTSACASSDSSERPWEDDWDDDWVQEDLSAFDCTLEDDTRATEFDKKMIQRVYALAHGEEGSPGPSFTALIVHDGKVVMHSEESPEIPYDLTRHAETGLIADASKKFSRKFLSECTLYASTEPCVMCAGACSWADFTRVVYGAPQNMDGRYREVHCREILERIAPEIEVIGPVLQEEGRAIRRRPWRRE